jgi:hypothetical protein
MCVRSCPLAQISGISSERFGSAVAKLAQIPLEEKVQKGSDRRDYVELPDLCQVGAIDVPMMSDARWKVRPATNQRRSRGQAWRNRRFRWRQ